MKLEQFLQSLENLGLTKCISNYDFVQKFSYSDCNCAFVTIWLNIRKCIIWSSLYIRKDGEISVMGQDRHQYDIDSEGIVIINKLKELIKQYKQMKIELKKKELNKDFV